MHLTDFTIRRTPYGSSTPRRLTSKPRISTGEMYIISPITRGLTWTFTRRSASHEPDRSHTHRTYHGTIRCSAGAGHFRTEALQETEARMDRRWTVRNRFFCLRVQLLHPAVERPA